MWILYFVLLNNYFKMKTQGKNPKNWITYLNPKMNIYINFGGGRVQAKLARLGKVSIGTYLHAGVPNILSINFTSWKKKHHLSHAPYTNHKTQDNTRQDCCGILPTFLSFGTHQGRTTPHVTVNQKPLWAFSSLPPQRNVSFPQQITIITSHHFF